MDGGSSHDNEVEERLNGGFSITCAMMVANGHAGAEGQDDTSRKTTAAGGQSAVDSKRSPGGSPKHVIAAKQRQPLLPAKLVLPRQRTFEKDSQAPAVGTAAAPAETAAAAADDVVDAECTSAVPAAGEDPLAARLVGRRMIPRYIGRSRSVTAPVSATIASTNRETSEDRASPAYCKASSAPIHESSDKTSKSSESRNGGRTLRTRRNSEQLSSLTASMDLSRTSRPTTPSALRLDLSRVQSKCGSMLNIQHTPRGGNVQIVSRKLEWKAEPKVGSLDNTRHTPRGGDKKIETLKLEWKAEPKVGSFDNVGHRPGGGEIKIMSRKLTWEAGARVGSLDNANHKPGGGDKKVEVHPVRWEAQARVGSLDNAHHQPGGGAVKVESHRLTFKETAMPKTDSGLSSRKSVGGSMTGSMSGSMTGSVAGSISGSDDHKPVQGGAVDEAAAEVDQPGQPRVTTV